MAGGYEQTRRCSGPWGVKVTAEYLEDLKKQIRQLEEKCALKDDYLKKMKEKAGQ